MTPPPYPHQSQAIIDLGAIAANWRQLADLCPTAECGAAVKADAYGLGMAAVAPALWRAGCRTFFVAHLGEGMSLRQLLPQACIHVLGGLPPGAAPAMIANRLSPVLASLDEVADWTDETGGAHPAALQADLGMNRLGLDAAAMATLAGTSGRLAAAGITLLLGHLSSADQTDAPETAGQITRFAAYRRQFPGLRASLANSSALFHGPQLHHDLVRPGIALYGGAVVSGEASPTRAVLRLRAPVLQIRRARAGETIGYGASHRLARDSRLAVISYGYADGLHRSASTPDTSFALHGRRAPVIGRISMDLTVVDVTDIPRAARGDMIDIIGPEAPLSALASALGTIDYEILTRIGPRTARIYLSD